MARYLRAIACPSYSRFVGGGGVESHRDLSVMGNKEKITIILSLASSSEEGI